MLSRPLTSLFLVTLLCGARPALGQDAPTVESPELAPTGEGSAPRRPARALTALDLSIRAVLQADSAAVAALRARARGITDSEQRLAIEREIATIKESTEESVIRLLLADARANGRSEQVARYERSLAEIAESRAAAEVGRASTPVIRVVPR